MKEREKASRAPTVAQSQALHWPAQWPEAVGHEPCEGIADAQVKFYTRCHGIDLLLI